MTQKFFTGFACLLLSSSLLFAQEPVFKPLTGAPPGTGVISIPQGTKISPGGKISEEDLCRQLKGKSCPLNEKEGFYRGGEKLQNIPEKPEKEKLEKPLEKGNATATEIYSDEFKPYMPLKEGEMTEGKVVEGVYYVVTPEKTTFVQMSNVDVNRIVCPVPIQDVVYSDEKGVKIKVIGRNAFVKFQIKKVDNKIEYSATPVDIHVVCNDKIFSIIAFPKKIPAVLVFLEDKELFLKERAEGISGMTFEEKMTQIVKDIFSGKIPFDAEYQVVNKKYELFKDISIEEKARYVLEGEGLIVRFFLISYTGNSTYVDLNERMFLKESLTARPLAISLGKLRLNKGENTELVLIERKPQEIFER